MMVKTVRKFFLMFSLCAAAWASLHATDPKGAIAALDALPLSYRDGVLKLSADNGNPNPLQWYILAKNSRRSDRIYSITIADGQIIAEKPSLDFREILNGSTAINLADISVDSTKAFDIAKQYTESAGKKLGSVSYVLEQKGQGAVPIWSIWCYDPSVRYIGYLEILATTGAVISTDGFPSKARGKNP